jgi:hypothetical protein
MGMRRASGVLLLALLPLVTGCAIGAGPRPSDPVVPPAAAPTDVPQRPAPDGLPAPRDPFAKAQPDAAADTTAALAVYYVAETAAGFRLQREFHRVAADDRPSEAVREMLANSTGTDPDYRNPWPAGTALRTPVDQRDHVITVDLTGLGAGQMGSELAAIAVQQLVFTVQGALQSTDSVRILVDGHRVDKLWGVIDTSDPVERGDSYELRSLVQIDAPAHGAEVSRVVRVTGEAAVFEASLLWEVRRGDVVVRSGAAATAEGQRFAPYVFEVTLEPGEYTVRVMEDDLSGGEGRPVLTDDKTITVS